MKYERGSFIVVPSRGVLRGLDATAQCLYMWLCAYANETGECFPSRSKLAEDCGCSVRSIDSAMQTLVSKGLVFKQERIENNENKTNLYTVIALPSAEFAPPPVQNLRTELYPLLTQNTAKAVSSAFQGQGTYVVVDEGAKPPKKKDPATVDYDEMCKWLSELTGAPIPNKLKQYAHLKTAKENKINRARLKERAEELWAKKFYQDNGMDWGSVVSSFNRKG